MSALSGDVAAGISENSEDLAGDAAMVRDTSMRIGFCSTPVILRVWHRQPRQNPVVAAAE